MNKILQNSSAHQKPKEVVTPLNLQQCKNAFTFQKSRRSLSVNKSLVHNNIENTSPTRVHRYLLRDSCYVDSITKLKPLELHYNFFPLPPEAANVLSGLPGRRFGWKACGRSQTSIFKTTQACNAPAAAAVDILPGIKVII